MLKTMENKIVKNLVSSEPTRILKTQPLGSMVSIEYIGINTNIRNSTVINKQELDKLEIIAEDGKSNFQGNPVKFSLFAEAERINSAYQFDPLFAVNCSIVDPLPHQIEAVYKFLLPQPRIRFLLADDTGAGKTIMTGLLIKELLIRGLIERILIITPGGLTKQWQEEEMNMKFNLPFKLANRAAFNSDPNIFSNSNKIITSIDFIRNEDVINILEDISWDIVIVDEAHKLSAFDYGKKRYKSKRYQALEKIATKCEHLLLLTATPHRGRRDTFKNLLQLLDEDIFASDDLVDSRIKEVSKKGVNKFFIRRLKEQMKDWNGNPLFKKRYTHTVSYQLTSQEKLLYDNVTNYLLDKRAEAKKDANVYVALTLMVMQRRLTSSIYAIKLTLKRRYDALRGLLDDLNKNPDLWKQRQKNDLECSNIEDFDELDDTEKEGLENILTDPKKFKLFTTAKNIGDIKTECSQVKSLFDQAESLYNQNQEEAKFIELTNLLKNKGALDKNEKLLIFTEHKDTLDYLEQRLKNNGYKIVTIHGGKSVDERRIAQKDFAINAQIMIATDAAGEGINLQFCRLLINWDIPWNPNRLEQRMGRIHRYGQKRDVSVFNMVAQNTREGNVLERLLSKLDLIREQLGDDRVYDVISDIFEGIAMKNIVESVFDGKDNDYNYAIDNEFTVKEVKNKINAQKNEIANSDIDYQDARLLKDSSDERRLQPIYVKLFFEKAFKILGGKFSILGKDAYQFNKIPDEILNILRNDYNLSSDISSSFFSFSKKLFLDYQSSSDYDRMHYINPGNPVFDSVVKLIRLKFREDMLKGTVLISPDDKTDYFAFFVKSQITDNRHSISQNNIADEKLKLVIYDAVKGFSATSPAKFIDLHPPLVFAKTIETPNPVSNEKITEWSFENITQPQFYDTEKRINADIELREKYLDEAFTNVIIDLTAQINELQSKILLGNNKVHDKISQKQVRIKELKLKKENRLNLLEQMKKLNRKAPEILGCAYVVPLNQLEYKSHYGMSRDDDVEKIAMDFAMNFEKENGWTPQDVSAENAGYDIRSVNIDKIKRYIEVKGRAAKGGVMLSENEMNRLAQLGNSAWLYIVLNCKTKPELHRIQNPAMNLSFEKKDKGVQYFLPINEFIKI